MASSYRNPVKFQIEKFGIPTSKWTNAEKGFSFKDLKNEEEIKSKSKPKILPVTAT